ncbi:MAG: hypothetical protein IKQ31_01480 [Clostridia bacterium]|nr:hypothetical protein [Clostridia bacterium]
MAKFSKQISLDKNEYLSYLETQKLDVDKYESCGKQHRAFAKGDLKRRLIPAALGSLALTGAFTFVHNIVKNSPLKQAHIEASLPERNAYIESVKEELLEKYPHIDIENMDSTNARDVLYSNYFDSYYKIDHGGWRGTETIVKDEMKSYYIDFKNHKLDYITDTLDNMANDFEHYPLLDSLREIIPAGLAGAVICFAWASYPRIRAKHNLNQINKEIAKVEAELSK